MEAALQLHQHGLDALAAVDTGAMSPTEIGQGLLSLQHHVDRLAVIHAKFCADAASANVHAGSGHRDLASWLAEKGKISKGRAIRQQKLGEAMNASPKLEDAVTNGDLSPDAAGELLPTMGSEHSGNLDDLIDACTGATPQQAKEAGELFRELNKPTGETDRQAEERKRAKRFLRLNNVGDGTTSITGLLPTTDARTVRDALASIAAKWADPSDRRTHEQREADALVELCHAHGAGAVTGGRGAPHVSVVIDIENLFGSGVGFNDKGEIVPAEIVRRMVPDAWVSRLLISGNVPINFGRTQRLASADQYLAIIARDGGFCRMPGCCIPAKWCQVDHLIEWTAQSGPTDIDWLVLFCSHHHHERHRPGVLLHGDANNLSITLANGDRIELPSKKPTGVTTGATTGSGGEPPGEPHLPLDDWPDEPGHHGRSAA
ncbi:MAG: DUF222 domain-containing protein [Ilumatobacteraceae bacterium]